MQMRWFWSCTAMLLGVGLGSPTLAEDSDKGEQQLFAYEDKALDPVTASALETFSGEREFRNYLKKLDEIKVESDADWSAVGTGIIVAASTQEAAEPVQTAEDCADPKICDESSKGDIVVTAQKVSAPKVITNNQKSGVDEGDIVKQIGNHLLVLQDGRIFAIDLKSMKLTDRKDVYRHVASDTPRRNWYGSDFEGADWYDEMLVQDDHILVTAYSYDDDATELSIFKLDPASGKIDSKGVFNISSDDYYSSRNYATRIVGDKLVIYTPYSVEEFAELDARPVIRRWVPTAERKDYKKTGKQLIDAHDIYKPVIRTAEPTIHSISICPLGKFERKLELECRTTALIGPRAAEMFVSPDNVYLWNSSSREADSWGLKECVKDWAYEKPYPALPRADRKDVIPGAIYRLSIQNGSLNVAGVSGRPFDQFSMDEHDGEFRALVDWRTTRCEGAYRAPAEVSLLKVGNSDFGPVFEKVSNHNYTPLPAAYGSRVQNRFADDWLVYGGGFGPGSVQLDDEDKFIENGLAVAVPLRRPKDVQKFNLPHGVIRAERVGNDMILNGYHDEKGLYITLLGLGKQASITSSLFLANRFESEGRSHAFNSYVGEDGEGMIGVPTVKTEEDSGRYYWRSETSDISFAAKAADGRLSDVGALIAKAEDEVQEHEDYECDVSCIDWYGNSRPIFTDGRIFALLGTELIEANIADGKIQELSRLDLTAPIASLPFIKRRAPEVGPVPEATPADEPDEIWISPSRETVK